jgi:hypothetical protein
MNFGTSTKQGLKGANVNQKLNIMTFQNPIVTTPFICPMGVFHPVNMLAVTSSKKVGVQNKSNLLLKIIL